MKISPEEAARLTTEATDLMALLFAALAPSQGEPWGRVTKDEARALVRALLRLAAVLARAAAS